jgi:hypothetical protein
MKLILAAMMIVAVFAFATNARGEEPETLACPGFTVQRRDNKTIVVSVDPQSSAAAAGLRKGDHVVGFCGSSSVTLSNLAKLSARKRPNDVMNVSVMRDGRKVILKLGNPGGAISRESILSQYWGAKLNGETVAVVDLNAPADVQARQKLGMAIDRLDRQARDAQHGGKRVLGDQAAHLAPADADDCLTRAEKLVAGQEILSSDSVYALRVTTDGGLALYRKDNEQVLWTAETDGSRAAVLVVQDDGNVVLSKDDGSVVWASNSHGRDGSRLVVQGDGNLVLYAGKEPVWATNTNVQ